MLAGALLIGTIVFAASAAPTLGQSCGGRIRYGHVVVGEIFMGGCVYQFTGKAGDVVAVRMSKLTSTLDPALEVTAGKLTRSDDDGGGGDNAAIAGFVLPTSGVSTISANAKGARSPGAFQLALAKCEPLPAAGKSLSSNLTEGQIACYTFSGRQGQAIDIRMDKGKADSRFDPMLDLYTPDGKVRISQTDRASATAQITSTLPASGVYTLIARSNRDQGAGSFTLERNR